MSLRWTDVKDRVPSPLVRLIRPLLRLRQSRARRESNAWLRERAAALSGRVLSIGSGSDQDGEGRRYREYFARCESYTTSEIHESADCDLALDVRSMPEIEGESYDVIFCSGVLEHVDDVHSAVAEMTRVLRPGGSLLLGLPFRQALHMEPHDYWRFTEYGIRWLLRKHFDILEITAIDRSVRSFPASYWTWAKKR